MRGDGGGDGGWSQVGVSAMAGLFRSGGGRRQSLFADPGLGT